MTLGWQTALNGEVAEPFMAFGHDAHLCHQRACTIVLIAGILVSLLRVSTCRAARAAGGHSIDLFNTGRDRLAGFGHPLDHHDDGDYRRLVASAQ